MANIAQLSSSFVPSSSSILRRTAAVPTSRRNSTTIQAKIREIFMPALSSTMTEGKIVSWVRSEGDKLSKGESVVVVESDKADMDVETFYDGYLAAVMVEEGGVAAVGSAIALLAETGGEIAEAKSRANSSGSAPPSAGSNPPEEPIEVAAAEPVVVPVKADVAAAASSHPASEGGKRVVASPYAKKLAKELKVDLGGIAGSGRMGRIVAKEGRE